MKHTNGNGETQQNLEKRLHRMDLNIALLMRGMRALLLTEGDTLVSRFDEALEEFEKEWRRYTDEHRDRDTDPAPPHPAVE